MPLYYIDQTATLKTTAMQTLHIILTVVSMLAYVATAFMAITAFFYMRYLHKEAGKMEVVLAKVFTLQLANNLMNNIKELNEMKVTFHQLIEDEQFEKAEQLKAVISEVEESVSKSLDELKKASGGTIKEVIFKNYKNNEE